VAEWKLKTGGTGLLFTPARPGQGGMENTPATCVQIHTLHGHLQKALERCRLPALTWYQATRHTFASQFVLAGGSIEKLSKLMGHCSVTTTERYAHLRADLFRVEDYDRLAVDLNARDADVLPLKALAEVDSGGLSYAGATHGKTGGGVQALGA
jgi:integrase